MNSERDIRETLKRLSRQRVGLVLQPRNHWVIEMAVPDDEQTDAALKTAWMRGWVEPIENAVPKGKLNPDGSLPDGPLYYGTGPIWRLTEAGWSVINRSHGWTLFAILLSILSLVVAIGSLVISIRGTSGR